ncbi:MAG: hypothetical protein JO247_12415 [Chloroflexi bacterium]|nr:hypothetical protein [Chloroflexota bacterium]
MAVAAAPPQAPQPRLALPERPKLAPGVRPAGRFEESAFVNPPWLIERKDAGYVQVTQLIYRIAELCTGENTYDDIARQLSDGGTPVRADTVQRLVAQLLLPRGLVLDGSGQAAKVARGQALSRINIRTREIGPDLIDPVTAWLKWLYWPPVMAALLIAGALAEGWLYFRHGIAGSLRDTLNAPGWMLVILLFVIVAAAFHELGHAAAMRYAGAKVNGMGAGLYMVYPAFYTDVTNNYRLRRWPRLRTDLGGFYFNLIFVLAVMGAYALTGQEFLLLVVLLINFEILHQLLPFLRLDGYWALADVTGVPDFMTQMVAFVRTVVPGLKLPGQKMPELKWWGKAVFAAYMLISLPLMALLIFVLVKATPRAFATAYTSALNQAHAFSAASASGAYFGAAAAIGQMLLLALPTAGLAYTLVLLARRLFTALWRWSTPTWPRRLAGAAVSCAIAAVLVWLWAPGLPTGPGGRSQPGVAYAAVADSQPLGPNDHGTVQDAVAVLPWAPAATDEGSTPNAGTSAPGAGGAAASASASGAPASSAGASASPASAPTVQPSAPPAPSDAAAPQQTQPQQVPTQQPAAVQPAPVYQSPAPAQPASPASSPYQQTVPASPVAASPAPVQPTAAPAQPTAAPTTAATPAASSSPAPTATP